MAGMVVGGVTIASIFVMLRMYTRLFINKSARWDDWTIVIALVTGFLLLVFEGYV